MSARIAGKGGAKALRLGGRQFDLERVRHTLGDFSLKLRGLRERTLVTLRPEPRPGRRLDQLQINRNRIGCSLNAPAQEVGGAQLPPQLAQLRRRSAGFRSQVARNHF